MMSKRKLSSIGSGVTTNNACEVSLSDDGKYIETLSITAIAAQPGRVELVAHHGVAQVNHEIRFIRELVGQSQLIGVG